MGYWIALLVLGAFFTAIDKGTSKEKAYDAQKDSALIGTWILKKSETGVGPEVVTVPVEPGIPPQVIVSLNKVAVIDEGKKKECKFEVYPGKNPRKLDILDVIDDHEGMLMASQMYFRSRKRFPQKYVFTMASHVLVFPILIPKLQGHPIFCIRSTSPGSYCTLRRKRKCHDT